MKCDGPRASSCSRSSDNHLVTFMRPPLYLHSRSFDKTTCSAEGRSVHNATMSGRAVCWIILASSSSHIIHQQWTAALHNSLVSSTLLSVRTLDTHQQLSTSWINSVLFTKGVTSETEVTYLITCADIWVSSARTEKNRTVRGCSSYQCYKNAQENCYLFSIEYFYKRKCV